VVKNVILGEFGVEMQFWKFEGVFAIYVKCGLIGFWFWAWIECRCECEAFFILGLGLMKWVLDWVMRKVGLMGIT
jgi:hypothetical protein